ncbi:hypothetical protein FISHEDRAFT_69648 [Fistulina hepatica ATCC 64428]|uniref:Uncharacterized protein n=1 Tax=Fistulina hepatica ATCC 64428 TaxID=1128425 RepID=A0A0D7AM32_9AGAR|nr:hypothetical protein FISHEDRAFT_69648 [Fistulina hepatica ATCC 64428]
MPLDQAEAVRSPLRSEHQTASNPLAANALAHARRSYTEVASPKAANNRVQNPRTAQPQKPRSSIRVVAGVCVVNV